MENMMPQNGASLFLVFPDGFGLVILSLNIKRSQRQRIMRATVFFAAVVRQHGMKCLFFDLNLLISK